MMKLYLLNLDYEVFKFLNDIAARHPNFDYLFVSFAEIPIFLMTGGIVLFFLLDKESLKRNITYIHTMLSALAGSLMVLFLFRAFFFRPRPFVNNIVFQLVPHNPLEGAFPSAHAVVMFAFAFSLFFANKRWGLVYIMLAAASSIARVIVGVHFPLDVLIGMLIGLASAYLCDKYYTPHARDSA